MACVSRVLRLRARRQHTVGQCGVGRDGPMTSSELTVALTVALLACHYKISTKCHRCCWLRRLPQAARQCQGACSAVWALPFTWRAAACGTMPHMCADVVTPPPLPPCPVVPPGIPVQPDPPRQVDGRTAAALVLPPALFFSDRQVRYTAAPVTTRFTRWVTDGNSTTAAAETTAARQLRTIAKVIFLGKLARKIAGPHSVRLHCEDCVSVRPTNVTQG
jgi:hypothetical protein